MNYLELDVNSMPTTRANFLYDQLVVRLESYRLLQVKKEGGEQMYDRLKEIAQRMERRKMTPENVIRRTEANQWDGSTRRKTGSKDLAAPHVPSGSRTHRSDNQTPRRFNCSGRGHLFKECMKPK